MKGKIIETVKDLVYLIETINDFDEKVNAINYIRKTLHTISPFNNNPVDFVEWVRSDDVTTNQYNPNHVAPPEMKLLKLSIEQDGYTQPIVTDKNTTNREIVDGEHRSRCGKEYSSIKNINHGYLPVTTIRKKQKGKANRIASTIRHNRARGTHAIKGMSDIVLELISNGWDDAKIAHYLGMDAEEVLRLKQITGLKQAFANHEFSKSWTEFESKISNTNNKD